MLAVTDHEMIVQSDADKIQRLAKPSGHLDVVAGRCRVAGRVVMNDDERGGIQEEGPLHDLAWVHGSVVDCALLLHLVGDQIVLATENRMRRCSACS